MKSKALKAIVSIIGLLLVLCVRANSLAAEGLFFDLEWVVQSVRQLNESKRLEALRSRSINRSSQCLVQQILSTFQWQPKRVAAAVNEHVESIQLYVSTWADVLYQSLKSVSRSSKSCRLSNGNRSALRPRSMSTSKAYNST